MKLLLNGLGFLCCIGCAYIQKRKHKTLKMIMTHVDIPSHMFRMASILAPLTLLNIRFIIVLPLAYALQCMKLNRRYQQLQSQLSYEFPIWTRLMLTYLQRNTVLRAIVLTLNQAPKLMREPLKELCNELEMDPTNRECYVNFMDFYQNYELQQMMKHLYRYTKVSKDDAKEQLERMVTASNNWIEKERDLNYLKRIEAHQYLGFIPLLLVSGLFMVLMFELLKNIMEGGWTP